MLKLKLQSFDQVRCYKVRPHCLGTTHPSPSRLQKGEGTARGHVGGTCSEGLGLGDSVHCLLILPGVAPSKQNSQAITFI